MILKPPAQCSEEEIKKKPPEAVRLVKHYMQCKGREHRAPTHTKYSERFWTRMNKTMGAIAVLYPLIIIKFLLFLMSQMPSVVLMQIQA